MTKKTFTLIIAIILILLIAVFAYWYFFFNGPGSSVIIDGGSGPDSGFSPFGRTNNTASTSNNLLPTSTSTTATSTEVKMARLRRLSALPVGGYAASTTASTTVVRWIDRGRGDVYELHENLTEAIKLSNTLLPRVFESVWDKNASVFIASMLANYDSTPTTVYVELQRQSSTTTVSTSGSLSANSPYQLKGKNLPEGIIAYAASPKKDKIFFLIEENGKGVGYVTTFDGKKMNKIFTTPLTKVNVEWPEENIIAITTKGSASLDGFLYLVNPKTGVWKKAVGPLRGLSTKVSSNGKYAIISSTGKNQTMITSVIEISSKSTGDAIVRTLADKCVWGNFYKDVVYCAVPAQVSAVYPDDWYKGTISFTDKIWQFNASNSHIEMIYSLDEDPDYQIDAFNFSIDSKDNYLFFMNKNDLSLWSLDLVSK